ncbi:hypothetical protein CEP54_011449 [Fusarium duplospermum]|uniref:Tyrosinase copper-binding domain-containing protein n=1 Tax=Fusarium duplospermum TaxID=1325734 RepID=A0A428PE57_9HYPO|nr:hypothetical protein CEP54_011449 [Fusarium duplospermum]
MSAKSTAKATNTSAKAASVILTPKKSPTWTDDILLLIQNPYWVSGDRAAKGKFWIDKMVEWGHWNLASYDDVKERAVRIYRHLRTKSMPITLDPQNYWPEDALEMFRTWVNAGFPQDSSDSPSPDILIPKPIDAPESFKIRRDIMSLSREELAVYQSKLDDILQVDALGSKWQELGLLHAYWCLHYQEATFLWHRAYLLYVEKLIGFPIPYWNGYTSEAACPKSEFAGIPPMFIKDTYIHPEDGSERPNPLKFALSLNGRSKTGESEFVTRSTTLTEGPSSSGWDRKIGLFKLYHGQIEQALKQSTYTTSDTAEHFGVPWTNITTFSEDQKDCLYPFRFDFDGLFEQVHDNFHGWVGPDMADNTYTAFDPIFLSYHANMDRLAGIFIDAHPESQFTSAFPLQPFINNGTDVSYDDPRRWRYTTIGDMAKDTRSLGYMYAAPKGPDVFTPASAAERGVVSPRASGGRAISLPAGIPEPAEANRVNGFIKAAAMDPVEKQPFVVFTGVGCTTSSYRIDVFTAGAQSLVPDVTTNPDFIGQVTRIGMGRGRQGDGPPNSGRCRKPAATRVLPAGEFKEQLSGGSDVKIVVTNVETGEELAEKENTVLPTRVLDVGDPKDSDPPLKLQVNEDVNKDYIHEPYLALSYCWGEPDPEAEFEPVLLRKKSLRGLTSGIDPQDLQKTIRDAIWVTRELGFRYLWVDALCIIQDDKKDKANEISQMSTIYKNASITLAAGTATGASEGFLDNVVSKPNIYLPENNFAIPMGNGAEVGTVYLSAEAYKADHPLDKRGWTLQEYMLSSRMLIFSDYQLLWQCKEVELQSVTGNNRGLEYQQHLESVPWKVFDEEEEPYFGTHDSEKLYIWKTIILQYTERNLKEKDDRLPAVSGITTELEKLWRDSNIYGLWRRWFISLLAWYKDGEDRVKERNLKRAPSWSWASLDGKIHYKGPLEHEDAKVKTLSMTSVVLSCRILDIDAVEADIHGNDDMEVLFDNGPQSVLEKPDLDESSWRKELGQKDILYLLLGTLANDCPEGRGLGLLVIKVAKGRYRRIGLAMFHVMSMWEGVDRQTIEFEPKQ